MPGGRASQYELWPKFALLAEIEEPVEDHPPASDIPGMLALVAVKEG